MSNIEAALLATVSHHSELHDQWSRLIAQATPAATPTAESIAVASPRRTKIAAWN